MASNENGNPEIEDGQEPQLSIGLTPFGQIGINITDSEGNSIGYLITDPNEAWQFAGHLNTLAAMQVMQFYQQRMAEKAMANEILKGTGITP